MARTCPWCREPVTSAQRRDPECPHCGRALLNPDGRELGEVDLRSSSVEEAQWRRYRELMTYGVGATAALAAVVPLLHLAAPIAAPLLAIVHLVLVRILLLGPTVRLLGRVRRGFTRWMTRLSFLWLGIPGYGLAAVPIAGMAAAAATFAGLTSLAHFYVLHGLHRERDRRPLAAWEKIALLALAGLTMTALVALALVVALLGITIGQIVGWLRS